MIGVEIFREGHVPLDILVPACATNEYTYNFVTSMFPTSSAREDLYEPRPLSRHSTSPQSLPSSTTAALVSHQTKVLHEIPGFPGVLEDGRWTARHPFVQIYLENVSNMYANATGFTGASTSRGEAARDVHGCIEVGRIEDVGEVIGAHLSSATAEMVFTLSALEVVDRIRHPAHFALWGETVRERTATVVKRTQGSGSILSSKTWDRWTEETRRIVQQTIYPRTRLSRRQAGVRKLNSQPGFRAGIPATRQRHARKGKERTSDNARANPRRSKRLAHPVDAQLQPAIREVPMVADLVSPLSRIAPVHAAALALLELSNPIHATPPDMTRGDSIETSRSLTVVAETPAKKKKRKLSDTVEDDKALDDVAEAPRRTLRSVRPVTAKGKAFAAEMAAEKERAAAIKTKHMKTS